MYTEVLDRKWVASAVGIDGMAVKPAAPMPCNPAFAGRSTEKYESCCEPGLD
jgi:hypothetical protein